MWVIIIIKKTNYVDKQTYLYYCILNSLLRVIFFHKRSFKNDSVNINWLLSCCCSFLNAWPSNKWASVWSIMHLSCIRSRDICSVEKHPKLKHSRHLWLIFSCVALKQSWWLFLLTKCKRQIHRTAVIIVPGWILSSVFLKANWSMSFRVHNHKCSFFHILHIVDMICWAQMK